MPRGVKKGQVLREKKCPVCFRCKSKFASIGALRDHQFFCDEGKPRFRGNMKLESHNSELNEVPA